MNFLTHQEIWDRVNAHLLAQNAPAYLMGGGCRYKTPTGLKCAVGCLIDEQFYDESFEGVGVTVLEGELFDEELKRKTSVLKHALLASGVDVNDPATIRLLLRLQYTHDTCGVEDWPLRLCSIAADFGLAIPTTTEKHA